MNCNIVYDLIPLYADGLCSEETAGEMKKHIEGCHKCSEYLKNYSSEVPAVKPVGTNPRRAFRKVRIYVLVSAVIIGMLLAACGLAGIYRLYVTDIGYMSADSVFFGYSTEKIMKSCDDILLSSVQTFFVYDTVENSRKWTDGMSLEEYNNVRKALASSEIDHSSLKLRELRGTDGKAKQNCEFTIDGVLGNGESSCDFSAHFLRLGTGRYYLIECTVMPADLGESSIFGSGYVLNVRLNTDLRETADVEYDAFDTEALPYVYYTYSDGGIPDGEYVSADGDSVVIDRDVIISDFFGESEYYYLDGEFVYPDRTEHKCVIYPKTGPDPRMGEYMEGYSLVYGDGKLIRGDTEYILSEKKDK